MRTFRRALLTLFMSAIFVLGLAGYGGREIYPFAPWDMYSLVPDHTVDFRIRIHRLGDTVYDPPQYLQDLPKYRARTRSVTSANALRQIGYKLMAREEPDPAKLAIVEQAFVPEGGVYDIVRIDYDAIEMFREGKFDAQILRRFETSGGTQ